MATTTLPIDPLPDTSTPSLKAVHYFVLDDKDKSYLFIVAYETLCGCHRRSLVFFTTTDAG